MSYITKFPMDISDDGKIETSDDPRSQFDLFTSVRPFTLPRSPEYGIDARVLMQNPIDNLENLLSMYLITLREKIAEFFTNITITRATAQFDKRERVIYITVFTQIEGEEVEFSFSVSTTR